MTVAEISSRNGSQPERAVDMPANDIAMEQAVLGSMMMSAAALAGCLGLFVPWPGSEVFFRPAHQIVFEAILALDTDSQPVDALTVKAELERRKLLPKIGGAPELHTLLAAVSAPTSAPYYARELLKFHARRNLRAAGLTIQQIAEQSSLDTAEMLDAAALALDDATGVAAQNPAGVSVASLLDPFLDALQAGPDTTRGILSGWTDLDVLIGGFRPGQLVTVAGRPAMGKSVVLLNIAAYVSIHKQKPVLVCSLEMSHDECMERLVASTAGVSLTALREHTLSEHDWGRIARVRGQLADAETLVINENQDMTIQGIRSELRAMRRAGMPAQMLVLDYLQLMENTRGKSENRQVEVSGFSRALKKLGKEFGIPVLVGSQLNRGPELRNDHKPLLADMRESGALEQDSDIAVLLYREDEYVDESPRAGEIDLIVAKNRQGPKGTVPLAFRGHYAACADLYRQDGAQ